MSKRQKIILACAYGALWDGGRLYWFSAEARKAWLRALGRAGAGGET